MIKIMVSLPSPDFFFNLNIILKLITQMDGKTCRVYWITVLSRFLLALKNISFLSFEISVKNSTKAKARLNSNFPDHDRKGMKYYFGVIQFCPGIKQKLNYFFYFQILRRYLFYITIIHYLINIVEGMKCYNMYIY